MRTSTSWSASRVRSRRRRTRLAATSVGVGGQGANVAAWVAALGGRSRLITARGTDLAAELVGAELVRLGVEVVGPDLAGHTGVVVSLSGGGQRRSMLTDRGVGTELTAAHVTPGLLTGLRLAARQRVRVCSRGDARRGPRVRRRSPRRVGARERRSRVHGDDRIRRRGSV